MEPLDRDLIFKLKTYADKRDRTIKRIIESCGDIENFFRRYGCRSFEYFNDINSMKEVYQEFDKYTAFIRNVKGGLAVDIKTSNGTYTISGENKRVLLQKFINLLVYF